MFELTRRSGRYGYRRVATLLRDADWRVKLKLNSIEVIDALTDLFILRGVPAYIRSDNSSEFIAEAVRDWIKAVGAKTAYIEPG